MFSEDFELLSNFDQERFRKITNYLLNRTFMLLTVYEPRNKNGDINGDYRFVERNFKLFSDYFDYCGFELNRDDNREIIYIESQYNSNLTKLDKFSTLFLLTLRIIYDEELEKNSSKNVVFVRTSDILVRMLEDRLVLKKPTVKETVNVLRNLIKYNIISRIEGSIDNSGCLFAIYPSIIKVVSNEKINAIYSIMFKELETPEGYDFDSEVNF